MGIKFNILSYLKGLTYKVIYIYAYTYMFKWPNQRDVGSILILISNIISQQDWKNYDCKCPNYSTVQPSDFLSLQTVHWSGMENCLNVNK